MGVLNCSRNGCESIGCDRYSAIWGYLCNKCFNELVRSGTRTDVDAFLESTPDNTEETIDPEIYWGQVFYNYSTDTALNY